jgi:hypothetical protein
VDGPLLKLGPPVQWKRSLDLSLFCIDSGGREAGQAQFLTLGLSEGGGLLVLWIDPLIRNDGVISSNHE